MKTPLLILRKLSFNDNIISFFCKTITIVAFQVAMVFSFYGQYLNQVNETSEKMELTYCYDFNEALNALFSVSTTIEDTNVTSSGPNFLEFKRYNDSYVAILNSQYGDTNHRYISFYGMEYLHGYYYCGGAKYDVNNSDTLVGFIVKWDTLGNVVWEKNYYTDEENVKIGYLTSNDSLIYMLSNHENTGASISRRTVLTTIDTSGSILSFSSFSGFYQQPLSIQRSGDNGVILSTTSQVTTDLQTRVYKLDSLNDIQWTKLLGPTSGNHALQVFEMPSGNVLGVGSSEESNTGYKRAWLVELDGDNGNLIKDTVYWFAPETSTFNGYSNVLFRSNEIILFASKSAAISGTGTPYHPLLISMDYNYEINWQREYYVRDYADGFYNIFEKDNFYCLQGLTYQDDPSNTHDEWFLVVDSLGCDDQWCTVGVDEVQHENSGKMTIYPNPSNGEFWVLANESVQKEELIITDLAGKIIQTRDLDNLNNIRLTGLSDGIYMIHLVANNQIIDTQKIVIQK